MNDINKWYADKCHIALDFIKYSGEPEHKRYEHFFYIGDKLEVNDRSYPWDISDPRCREIIREKFQIINNYDGLGTWIAETFTGLGFSAKGTIAEAELSCLQAIYEARDD